MGPGCRLGYNASQMPHPFTPKTVQHPTTLDALGVAMGTAWLSGINLYATVVTLGLLQRFHLARLPGDLDYLQHWWVILLAGALYLIEFAADKIPAVGSIWGAVHTVIRVPGWGRVR